MTKEDNEKKDDLNPNERDAEAEMPGEHDPEF